MPIAALPEDTTRILLSSLVLNDAKSVVKELVDNALDARATAISVEISANTIDVVQVKDNGTGIDVQDRQLLFKRGCTSKIRTIEDLERLGGTSLGFRGEALASIVDLSQDVVVKTRVEGEVAGTAIKFDVTGMISSSSASHPVGTTITVHDLLTRIPVRKQTALKTTSKTLDAIRSLLFSFAFARPEVRFSLKVLKGKKDKMNWTYAGTPVQSLMDVATRTVGAEISSMCTAHTITSTDCDIDIGSDWSISAVLLSADADYTKVRSATQHISVDGRPVNAERGTVKEIAKSYKRRVHNSILASKGSQVSRPFLYMQIRCPPHSYDVNVEPTKDEVLFSGQGQSQLLSLVESLFSRAYPNVESSEEASDRASQAKGPAATMDSSTFSQNMLRTQPKHDNMSSIEDDSIQETVSSGHTSTPKAALRNPFSITAMNAKVQAVHMDNHQPSPISNPDTNSTLPIQDRDALGGWRRPSPGSRPKSPNQWQSHSIISPDAGFSPPTSPRPGPPMARRAKASTHLDNEDTLRHSTSGSGLISPPNQTGLNAWLRADSGPPRSVNLQAATSKAHDFILLGETGIASSATMSQALDVPSRCQKPRELGAGPKPFRVPFRRNSQGQPCSTLPVTPPPTFTARPENLPLVREDNSAVERNAELDDIMDFEHRKKAAITHQRRLAAKFAPTPTDDIIAGTSQADMRGALGPKSRALRLRGRSSVDGYDAGFGLEFETRPDRSSTKAHRQHYLDALKDSTYPQTHEETYSMLTPSEGDNVPPHGDTLITEKIILLPNDPRAYLMRQQQKSSHGKLHRTKSAKLPLESILANVATHDLAMTTDIFDDLEDFHKHVTTLSRSDLYLTHNKSLGTDFGSNDVSMAQIWEHNLRSLIKARFPAETQEQNHMTENLEFTFLSALQETNTEEL